MINNNLFHSIQSIILKTVLKFTILGGIFSGIINYFNQRPLINTISAFGVSLITFFLLRLVKNSKYINAVRLTYIVFFTNLYIPFGWLTSPGSTSAFPYYSLLLIVASSMLIANIYELIIPFISLSEIIFLLQYEALYPNRFYQYTDRLYRANDLSINIFIITIILIYLLFSVNKYTISRDAILYNFSTVDQLTGVYNRRYLFNTLENLHHHSEIKLSYFTLAMLDINGFKEINDTFGHTVGDEVLVQIGNLLNNFYQNKLISGRYGGDEFMIIFPNHTIEEVYPLMSELENKFNELSQDFGKIDLSFSFGLCDSRNKTLEEIVQTADRHLYRDKF